MEDTIGDYFRALGMFIGFFIIGILGTYLSVKDKVIISSDPGATFDLYLTYFGLWAVTGALVGYSIGLIFGLVVDFIIDHVGTGALGILLGFFGICVYQYFINKKKKGQPSLETDNTNLTRLRGKVNNV